MRKILLLVLLLLLFITSPVEAFSGKVGTFFFHWYRCPDNTNPDPHSPGVNNCDVSNLKIKNIAPGMKGDDPYPEGGYYDSGNLNWYKREFTDMVNTGINFALVVDLYQTDSFYKDSQIALMGDAITQLNLPLRLGLFWDPPNETFDLSKTDVIHRLYQDYVFPLYNTLPRDIWVMYNNRPVIFTVYPEEEIHKEKARDLFLNIKNEFKRDFGVEPWLVVDKSWWSYADLNGVADGRCNWGNTTETVGGFTVTLVGPGVDMRNTPWGGPNSVYIDRRNGDYFKEELVKVPTDANFLMISSWNELFENTGIQRAINYKDSSGNLLPEDYYMGILRNYLGLTNSVRNAEVKFSTVPEKVNAGEDFEVSVEVKNKGFTYWSKKDGYALGTQDPFDNLIWGTGRIHLADNEVVFPNSSKNFTFGLKAPDTVGVQKLSLKMVQDGVEWFGDKVTMDITVVEPPSFSYLGRGWNYITSSGGEYVSCLGSWKYNGLWKLDVNPKMGRYYRCGQVSNF